MNLIEKLILIDKERVQERKAKKLKSARLSKLTGEETEITIKELSGKRLNDLTQIIINEDGKKDFGRMYDLNLMYCVEGVVEPNLKDSRLLEHFGVKTPKDLAAMLFEAEAGKIAGEIVSLSGIGEGAEEEVKN